MKRTRWCDTCGQAMGHSGFRHETERQCIAALRGVVVRLATDVEMLRAEVQKRA